MRAPRRARSLAVALGLACAATGCSAVEGALPPGDAAAEGPAEASVVVLVPERGRLSAEGSAVATAVEVAVAEAVVPGWTVSVRRVDDGGDAAGAAAAAEEVASDDHVIAVVGGLSAPVVRAVQPVLDRAGIPFVSPADTAPEHTRGADPSAPQRPYDSYFRTAVLSGHAPQVAAEYAVETLGARTVAVVDGGDAEGAAEFVAATDRLGARVVGVEVPEAGAGEGVPGVVAAARRAGAVYVAGSSGTAAAVARAVADAGLEVPVLGGGELLGDEFLEAAGAAAEGAVAVTSPDARIGPGDLPGTLTGRLDGAGPGVFGAAAYDAGTAVAQALERCLPPVRAENARAARRGCVAELGGVAFDGVTGPVSFDRFGDRVGGTPEVFVVRDGAWERLAPPGS